MSESSLETKEITIVRVFAAPPDVVFRSFTEAEHIAKWWGPEGFGVGRCESDAREGGAFAIVMVGPDEAEYPARGTYEEFQPPTRLVAHVSGEAGDGIAHVEATITVTLADLGGETELTLVARGAALTPEGVTMLSGMEAGWAQSLRRLDDELTGVGDRQVVLLRTFEAPRERVFEAWTTQEQLERWFAPEGMTITTDTFDAGDGGKWGFRMSTPDGKEFPGSIVFERLRPPEELVYLYPGSGYEADPPCRVTVSLDEFGGNTVLTSRMVFDTPTAKETKFAGPGAMEGANAALDRLGAFIRG